MSVLSIVAVVFGFYFLAAGLLQAGQLLEAVTGVRRGALARRAMVAEKLGDSGVLLPVSVVIPAHNEEAGVLGTVDSMLALQYPTMEVIVVNDGSTDATLALLTRHLDLQPAHQEVPDILPTQPVRQLLRSRRHPKVLVVDKAQGGKSDALNAGLNVARYPLFCSVDADSILDPKALLRVAEPMVREPDTVATGGIVRVANGCVVRGGRVVEARIDRKVIVGVQVVEYLRAFLLGRMAWSKAGSLLIISGAFAMFRRDAVMDVGGYSVKTVSEDAELVTRIHHKALSEGRRAKVLFVADPVCWTEVPSDWRSLRRQRMRWQQGLVETLWAHREVAFRRRSGVIGTFGMPYFWVVEVLGPIAEVITMPLVIILWLGGEIPLSFAVVLFLISLGIGAFFSSAALVVEEATYRTYNRPTDFLRLVRDAIIESFVVHQLLAVWRVEGTIAAIRKRDEWGKPRRVGATQETAPRGAGAGGD